MRFFVNLLYILCGKWYVTEEQFRRIKSTCLLCPNVQNLILFISTFLDKLSIFLSLYILYQNLVANVQDSPDKLCSIIKEEFNYISKAVKVFIRLKLSSYLYLPLVLFTNIEIMFYNVLLIIYLLSFYHENNKIYFSNDNASCE